MFNFWQPFPQICRSLQEVSTLTGQLVEKEPPPLRDILKDLLFRRGKYLRAGFCLLAGGFGEEGEEKLITAAAALEMLHLATLIHDDIIDEAPRRRGKIAAHRLYGLRKSILCGDFLYSQAFLLAADFLDQTDSFYLAKAVGHICRQEMLQSLGEQGHTPGIRSYLRRIAGKTAVLFLLSFYAGGKVSGASPSVCETLRRIGYNLGMAFQIIDDIMDFQGKSSQTGKPLRQDYQNGFVTLPYILAKQRNPDGLPRRLSGAHVEAWITKNQGFREARIYAQNYTNRVFQEVEKLPPGASREILMQVAEACLHRHY